MPPRGAPLEQVGARRGSDPMDLAHRSYVGGKASNGAGLLVLANSASALVSRDSEALVDRIRRAFDAAGRAADVRLIEPAELAAAVRTASEEHRAIVVAGGDGSISTAAGMLAGSETALGVLPLGTLNHFARDIGMPADLEAAANVLTKGTIARVDVGEVNGRIFVNNSSVGIYAAIVADRDRQRREHRRGKWLALTVAGVRALRHYQRRRLTVSAGERTWRRRTSLLFVGNNNYQLRFPSMGARPRLDGGHLCLFAIFGRGWRLVRLALLALIGATVTNHDFERAEGLREVIVTSEEAELPVAIDGEIEWLLTPLRYRIRPLALTVIRPASASPGA
jgi:diacylglycerol kinase family enzyme